MRTTRILFLNPLQSREQEQFIRSLIGQDVQKFLAARPGLLSAVGFYSITRFVWRIGIKTVTMPTVSVEKEKHSRG